MRIARERPWAPHWTQKARADHGRLTVELFLPIDGQDGGGSRMDRSTRHWPMFVSRGSGPGISRTSTDWTVDLPTVVRLRVTMFAGRHDPPASRAALGIEEVAAAARYRFFVRFFAG